MGTFIEEYANLGGGTTKDEQMKASWWLAAGAAVVISLSGCAPGDEVGKSEPTATGIQIPTLTPRNQENPTPEPLSIIERPVTLRLAAFTDIPTLDPQVASDIVSINYIENLFVKLTNTDLASNEIVPEAATSWEISADGMTYTFYLRTDIPRVNHNPVTG